MGDSRKGLSTAGATAVGALSMVFWGMIAGLERLTSQTFGAQLGIGVIYLIAVPLAFLVCRPDRPSAYSLRYLVVCGLLFGATDVLMGLAIGLAATPTQAVQVMIVNYLWPTLTVLGTLAANREAHANWLIVPGTVVATLGVATVVGGDAGLDPASIAANMSSNPLPFALALADAICWSVYSVLAPRLSGGKDALPYFFTMTLLGGWAVWAATSVAMGPQLPSAPVSIGSFLAPAASAVVIVLGYSCWNVGILQGDAGTLSMVSYVTPVCSGIASAIILHLDLAPAFYLGLALVVAGSVLSLASTRIGGAGRAHEAGGSAGQAA